MSRIKYKQEGNCLVTANKILCGKDIYTACIDATSFEYVIVDSEAIILKRGKSESLRGVKAMVRNALIDMGAVIYDEVRQGA